METINLKEILNGELIDEPGNLNAEEKYDFAMALTHALGAMQADYDTHSDEWDCITDNYLSYMMDNFSIEVVVGATIAAFRVHLIGFNVDTEIGQAYFKEYQQWIVPEVRESMLKSST